ncbi:MAG: hypothetical protein ACLR8Y_03060 [Alistipes indistinctus]
MYGPCTGIPLPHPYRPACLPGSSRSRRGDFRQRAAAYYSGGSIPIISTFEKVLGLKSVLLGFGLDQDAIHSPNESYALENFYRGIDTIARFHRHFAAILKSHA